MWRCQGLVLSTNVQNQKLRKIRKCHIDIPVFLSPVPFHSVSIMIHWQGKLNLLDSSTEHTIASFLCFSWFMWRSAHQNRRWCLWFWSPRPPGQFQSFQPSICHLFDMCILLLIRFNLLSGLICKLTATYAISYFGITSEGSNSFLLLCQVYIVFSYSF